MRLPFDELDVHAELESALRDWLPQEAPSTAPMDLRQRVFDRSVTIRQRDGRLRRVALTRTRIGGLAFAAAGLGMAIVIGGMALFGGGVSETVGTSPSPSDMRPAPSPSASAPVALSPWVRGVPLPGDPAFDDPPPEYIGLDGGRVSWHSGIRGLRRDRRLPSISSNTTPTPTTGPIADGSTHGLDQGPWQIPCPGLQPREPI